jgi:hypothetical protein
MTIQYVIKSPLSSIATFPSRWSPLTANWTECLPARLAHLEQHGSTITPVPLEEYATMIRAMSLPKYTVSSDAYKIFDLAVVGDGNFHAKRNEILRERDDLRRILEAAVRGL